MQARRMNAGAGIRIRGAATGRGEIDPSRRVWNYPGSFFVGLVMTESATDHAKANRGPLAAKLLAPETFPALVDDCRALVSAEMRKKGMTLRTAFGVVQRLKPDIVERTVREQMPDFVTALEPCYADYRQGETRDFHAYLLAHQDTVADAVLAVADRRADRIHSRTIHSAYNKVRGRARREVLDAVPALAAILARHAEPSVAAASGPG